jgi:hypothetical protein
MSAIAFHRANSQALVASRVARREQGLASRGWQDKSRKVRPVGRLENASNFRHAPNIAKLRHNFQILRKRCSSSAFGTLRGARWPAAMIFASGRAVSARRAHLRQNPFSRRLSKPRKRQVVCHAVARGEGARSGAAGRQALPRHVSSTIAPAAPWSRRVWCGECGSA